MERLQAGLSVSQVCRNEMASRLHGQFDPGLSFIMVIALSGVQFGLKSNA